ncbi:type I 3-dehydroquinate dehydratase [Brotaphodocola sp.]|uniref:type I 3-dehydroquinate dehydratase n=1 Tax=Brotaphodocola sp. TaxID=3073577 RepID=UPI003D7ED2EC
MKKSVTVRNVTIGEGLPKICVPIVGTTLEEITASATNIKSVSPDVVEWRVDYFSDILDQSQMELALHALREILPDTPLLFTFRTQKEGGEREISMDDYILLNHRAVASGLVDLIDVEIFSGDDVVQKIIADAHAHQIPVIASNHHFHETPVERTLMNIFKKMDFLGADILKIAVMPTSRRDVLRLLYATETTSQLSEKPIITMSMGGTGLISRLCGEVFGSALTFGAVGKASAPGQINAEDLRSVLNLIHQNLPTDTQEK